MLNSDTLSHEFFNPNMAFAFILEENLLDIFKNLVQTSSNILEGFVSYLGKNYIGTHLNGDIWNVCTPRKSSYPSMQPYGGFWTSLKMMKEIMKF